MIHRIKDEIWLNSRNALGWRSPRKIVVIAVDDYGNVRLASREARKALDEAGLQVRSRLDLYDTLEDAADLGALYDVLTSVKDKNGRHAVFTPLALPMNIDFEKIRAKQYDDFYNEPLTETFEKLPGYEGTWELWKQGMEAGIFLPQFHGREHLNLKMFRHLLRQRDPELMANLENRSYASISSRPFPNINYPAAFHFEEFAENESLKEILREGLETFEQVFGYRATLFNAPAGREHRVLHEELAHLGVRYIESSLLFKEHQGRGKYKTELRYTGKKNEYGQTFLVRNVVFEPAQDRGLDWVDFALRQIAAAFRWRRPAQISSHRVNFCGRIDEKNREKGLSGLKELLQRIVKTWPDVEFMAGNELGDFIAKPEYATGKTNGNKDNHNSKTHKQ